MKNNCKVWKRIGDCGVDAGLLFIGDPCYLSRKDWLGDKATEEEKEGNPFRNWSSFCDKLFKHEDANKTSLSPVREMVIKQGTVFGTIHGDGSYGVYYYETFDGVKGVTVVLDGDIDEVDEEDEVDKNGRCIYCKAFYCKCDEEELDEDE